MHTHDVSAGGCEANSTKENDNGEKMEWKKCRRDGKTPSQGPTIHFVIIDDRPLMHERKIGVVREIFAPYIRGTENLLSAQFDEVFGRSSSGDTDRFSFFFYPLAYCVMCRYLPCVTFSTETFIAFLVAATLWLPDMFERTVYARCIFTSLHDGEFTFLAITLLLGAHAADSTATTDTGWFRRKFNKTVLPFI